MRTVSYTDLRANLKSYIDAVIDDYDTVVINRGNGKGVVMISLDEYNSLKDGKNGVDCYSKNGHAVTVLTRQS